MQWDTPLLQALLHTLGIGCGVALLASCFALLFVLAFFWCRISAWPVALLLVSSFLMVPVYVQASAWSAGFGDFGWLRLSQVSAAKNPWFGIASVIWIHTCSILPSCLWILSTGSLRASSPTLELALLEQGPYTALRTHWLPKMRSWFLLSLLWAFCSVQADMVVTNLFQVPTLCESIYQQVQFGRLRAPPIATAWIISIACGLSIALLVKLHLQTRVIRYTNGQQGDDRGAGQGTTLSLSNHPILILPPPVFFLATIATWLLVLLVAVLPWCNLLSRLGWVSTLTNNIPSRSWSLLETLNSLWHVQDFRNELSWSVQLCLWSSLLSLALALFALRFCFPPPPRHAPIITIFIVALLACMLAVPGPLINLAVAQTMLQLLPQSLDWLYDQTLLPPILALQFRTLPISFGILWIAFSQYRDHYRELVITDQILPFRWKAKLVGSWMLKPTLATLFVSFTLAFGDLSTYLLVQPPGVTTIAMRMFDLLHYGTKNREAALALFLAVLTTIPCAFLIISLRRNQKKRL